MGYVMLFSFLALGMAAAWRLLPGAGRQVKLWLGAVLGMVEMMWLPSLFAFFLDFTALAQYLALGAACLITGLCFLLPRRAVALAQERPADPPAALTLWLVVPFLVLSAYLQYTHVLKEVDGALYAGQSTYGDLCLHLGIATGLRGASYPPEYTLLPGTLLGYPFLFDALSASMLTFNTALAPAFTLPGTLAMGLTYWGFVLLAWEMTGDKRAVAIAYLLVFLNGGLGFLYMLDGWPTDSAMFQDIFFGFYRTPTNLLDLNLRWVNVICDLMVPQRTLLAGWMAVLPAMYLLVRGVKSGAWGYFVALGLWAGAMPMIHTHSFLALGLISFGCMAWQLVANRRRAAFHKVLGNYLIYGLIALALALPQLLTWTFPQSVGSGKLTFRFNWVNTRDDGTLIDGYFWFWIKNVGLPYLLLLPAALNAPKKLKPLMLGALTVYVAAELFQFQPNVYDNNKLFYVAFILMMPMVGRLMSGLWARMGGVRGRWMIALPVMVVCLLSGALTVGREVVSEYPLFSRDEVGAASFIEQSAPMDAVFLTGGQHNNPVAALAGRKLVCGTGSYLYFHGVNYESQARAAQRMYERPLEELDLFEAYGVDYVYLSAYERGAYDVDEQALRQLFPVWYEDGSVTVLRVT